MKFYLAGHDKVGVLVGITNLIYDKVHLYSRKVTLDVKNKTS